MPKDREMSLAEQALARQLYDESHETLAEIAERVGLGAATFRRYRHIWNWPPRPHSASRRIMRQQEEKADRRKNIAGEGSDNPALENNACSSDKFDQTPHENTRRLSRRVETAVRRELANVEKRLRTDSAEAAERNARVLASLVKSLVELGRLDNDRAARIAGANEQKIGGFDERAPRDLAELREELAARLASLRADRSSGGGDEEP